MYNNISSGIYSLLLKLDPGAVIDEIYINGEDTDAVLTAFASFVPQTGLATFFERGSINDRILVANYRKIDAISFLIPPPPPTI